MFSGKVYVGFPFAEQLDRIAVFVFAQLINTVTFRAKSEMIGNHVRVKVVKNKIAPPFKEAEFDIMFGKGISKAGDILDLAAGIDVVKKSGAWYAYEGEKIGQGRENAKAYLESHPEVMEELDRKVRAHYHLSGEGENAEEGGESGKADGKAGAGKKR